MKNSVYGFEKEVERFLAAQHVAPQMIASFIDDMRDWYFDLEANSDSSDRRLETAIAEIISPFPVSVSIREGEIHYEM